MCRSVTTHLSHPLFHPSHFRGLIDSVITLLTDQNNDDDFIKMVIVSCNSRGGPRKLLHLPASHLH